MYYYHVGTALWGLPRTEPHVLKASIHPVARQWLIIVYPRRAHLDAGPPQAHDLPGLVHNAFLHVMHQLSAFLGITLDFLPLEELVHHRILETTPIVGGAGGEFDHNLIGITLCSKAEGIHQKFEILVTRDLLQVALSSSL